MGPSRCEAMQAEGRWHEDIFGTRAATTDSNAAAAQALDCQLRTLNVDSKASDIPSVRFSVLICAIMAWVELQAAGGMLAQHCCLKTPLFELAQRL